MNTYFDNNDNENPDKRCDVETHLFLVLCFILLD